MTRETKIGLLVGLAFIIVIGILLSDHMTSTNEPIAAPLTNTAGNVRESVAAPVTDPPPITVVTQEITPRDTVQTHGNNASVRRGESIVQVGPAGSDAPIQIRQTASVPSARTTDSTTSGGNNASLPTASIGSLQDVARANGEQVVAEAGTGNAPRPAADASNGGHKYTAQPGDTLSRLAGRFLGGNTKANRDLIVKANPSLASDPNRMIVGRAYVIPDAASASPAPTPETVATGPIVPTAPVANTPAASQDPQFWYTVKENDSLWSIAADQLGNGSAWTAIKDLNADILKGNDSIHPNMKLRLPAKPLASAQ
jgi:nucleoid-associated protein YgaU